MSKKVVSNSTPKNQKCWNFNSKRKIFLIVSLSLIAITLLATLIFKIDVAIEFKGGTILTYTYSGDVDSANIEKAVKEIVNTPVKASLGENIGTGENNITIEFTLSDNLSPEKQSDITNRLIADYPDANIEISDSADVSASSGKEFFLKCFVAVLLSIAVLIIYIAFRFRKIGGLSAGVCAITALCQDLVLTYGSFILCGFEINSNFMAVILTILGYSINNTIVIYDRIRENKTLMPKATLAELVNLSCTQSWTRSIRTTITTVSTMIIVSIVVAIQGYTSLLSFTIPLIFGMTLGTYSSLCVAPMLWVWWNERKDNKEKKN